MIVYLAGPISRRGLLLGWKQLIEASGRHTVNSRYLHIKRLSKYEYDDPRNYERFSLHAEIDKEDIRECDVIVCDNVAIDGRQGGRDYECGYGDAFDKEIVLVGPPRIVFHGSIPSQRIVTSIDDVIPILDEMQDARDDLPT